MAKPKLCKWKAEPCLDKRVNYPGSSILSPFCRCHLAINHIYKERQNKADLEKVRNEIKMIKKSDKSSALKLADNWFSKYIRFKYSYEMNGSLYCECYTCGHSYLMKAMDNGHWQKRENKLTRFHENNARPQCTECNDHRKGEYAKFELHLISEIGIEEVEKIKKLAIQSGEDSYIFYKEQSDKYRVLLKQLFKERKTKNPWIYIK